MRRALSMSSPVACCSTSGKGRAQPFPPALHRGLASAAASKSKLRIEDVALTVAEPMQEGFYEARQPASDATASPTRGKGGTGLASKRGDARRPQLGLVDARQRCDVRLELPILVQNQKAMV
jgi:hypothetical protein